MAKTLQFRRDTTANLASVTGANGEIFIDTTKKTVVVMDGSTAGGYPLELQGAGTGATGVTGSNGTNGATGVSGIDGATGVTGSNGTNGATGVSGASGATGAAGTNGGVGATGISGASGPGADQTVNTTSNVQHNSLGVGTAASASAGEIRATGNVTAYYTSDITLKENIQDIDGALDKVLAIGGKTYDWTDDFIAKHGGLDDYFMRKSDFGVIAQEVQAVFPVAVRAKEDGTLAVDYEKLSALAFAAIKELYLEVQKLNTSNK